MTIPNITPDDLRYRFDKNREAWRASGHAVEALAAFGATVMDTTESYAVYDDENLCERPCTRRVERAVLLTDEGRVRATVAERITAREPGGVIVRHSLEQRVYDIPLREGSEIGLWGRIGGGLWRPHSTGHVWDGSEPVAAIAAIEHALR